VGAKAPLAPPTLLIPATWLDAAPFEPPRRTDRARSRAPRRAPNRTPLPLERRALSIASRRLSPPPLPPPSSLIVVYAICPQSAAPRRGRVVVVLARVRAWVLYRRRTSPAWVENDDATSLRAAGRSSALGADSRRLCPQSAAAVPMLPAFVRPSIAASRTYGAAIPPRCRCVRRDGQRLLKSRASRRSTHCSW